MKTSIELFDLARKYIPGGVNSPVRAFKAVSGRPIFIEKAAGSKIYDVEGKEYIDYVGSWGPMILGHAHPEVISALKKVIDKGTSFGAPAELEIELAKLVIDAVPSIETVRMVNSGTEAAMSAIRLARGYTRRDWIIKFEGCYHGHADSLLVKAGSGAATLGVPTSPGVPADFARYTITVPFNDIEKTRHIIEEKGKDIACVIVEPVPGNMGVIVPADGFLHELRRLTEDYGIVLIFDEVMSGFRVAYGGAQEIYSINPDLTCLGKIIGGGLPVGAYGGRKEIMDHISPEGPVYQAGTLSGNPLAMTAGIETLKRLCDKKIYQELEDTSKKLCEGIANNAKSFGISICTNRVGSMFCSFFTDREVKDYSGAVGSDTDRFADYFAFMLKNGIYIAPSQFEAGFVSAAHTDEDIERSIEASYKAMKGIKN